MNSLSTTSGTLQPRQPLQAQGYPKKDPDYWVARGQKFEDISDISAALKKGDLEMPKSGEMHIAKKGWQPEVAVECKSKAKKCGLAALAGLGITLATAALFPASLAVLPLMMGTMLSGGVGMGFYKAGEAFEDAPQIIEQGDLSVKMQNGQANLIYDNLDSDPQNLGQI